MTLPAAFSSFQIGGELEPLSTSSANTLLRDADPSLYFALDYWAWAIRNYPGLRFLQAAQAAGLQDSTGKPIQSSVETTLPYDPAPYLAEEQIKLPLLACYRKESEYFKHASEFFYDHCTWDLLWVLPAMRADQAEQLMPIRRSVAVTLFWRTMVGFDPGYTPPGGTPGQVPWGLPFASVMAIGLGKDEYGSLDGAGNLVLPTLRMQGWFDERNMPVRTGVGTITGVDIDGQLVASDGTIIDQFVAAQTNPAPTITSVIPAMGPHAGGTAVTVTGTGFLPGIAGPPGPPMVFFNGKPAVGVTRVNSTTITCTTPVLLGAGTATVAVLNSDGQTASLVSGFTFT